MCLISGATNEVGAWLSGQCAGVEGGLSSCVTISTPSPIWLWTFVSPRVSKSSSLRGGMFCKKDKRVYGTGDDPAKELYTVRGILSIYSCMSPEVRRKEEIL